MQSAPHLRPTRSGRLTAAAVLAAFGLTACAAEGDPTAQESVSLDRVAQVEEQGQEPSQVAEDKAAEQERLRKVYEYRRAKKARIEARQAAKEQAAQDKAAEQERLRKVYEYRRAKKARIEARQAAEAQKAAEQAQLRKVYEYRRAKQARIEARQAAARAQAEAERQQAAQQAWAEKVAQREASQQAARQRAAEQRAAQQQAARQRVAVERTAATTSTPSDSVWDRLAQCETGGNWSMNSGNGFYGGIQFKQDVWVANGGARYAPMPHMATREQQIAMGKKIHALAGWGAWPGCQAKLGL